MLIVSAITWEPLNASAKAEAEATMDGKIQHLRDLVPDSGAYVNEVCSGSGVSG